MTMSINSSPDEIISGLVACPDGLHVWKPGYNSHANHSFGAAAERDPDSGDVTVTLYTEVRGQRVGELKYPADVWDRDFIGALGAAAQKGVENAYKTLDGILVRDLGHRSVLSMVEFDLDNSDPYQQVRITQHGPDGQQRMVSDSILAFKALMNAAMDPEERFSSTNLLAVTEFIPQEQYFSQVQT